MTITKQAGKFVLIRCCSRGCDTDDFIDFCAKNGSLFDKCDCVISKTFGRKKTIFKDKNEIRLPLGVFLVLCNETRVE